MRWERRREAVSPALFRLGAVAACTLLAACGESTTNRTGPGERSDPDPAVFDWVGTWQGEGTGLDRGTPVDESVTLRITFDRNEECETCVRVDLGHLFDRDSLLITDPVRTELSYVDGEGRRHRLELQRVSTGEGAGHGMVGRAEVSAGAEAADPDSLLYVRDVVLRKQVR